MAKSVGFFTRQELKSGLPSLSKKTKSSLDQLPAESLWKLGTKAVRGMNPHAIHPEMDPIGSRHPEVYVLGEAPGEQEDKQGVPFVGSSGKLMRPLLEDMKIRINNVVRTRPPQNRQPTFTEIEAFRPSLVADIEATKPKAIIGTGAVPLQWALGSVKNANIRFCRGRRFPLKVGEHSCWFYPVHHPAYLLRLGKGESSKDAGSFVKKSEEEKDVRMAEQWMDIWKRDFRRVEKDLKSLPVPRIYKPNHDGIVTIIGKAGDIDTVERMLKAFAEDKWNAFDFETSNSRCYELGFKVLSLAVSNYTSTLSVAIDHPQAVWSGSDKRRLLDLLKAYFRSTSKKIAHNLAFDLEVLVHMFGRKMARASRWHCTMQQVYTLDCRQFPGTKNDDVATVPLSFLTLEYLGFDVKKFSPIDRKKLATERLEMVLRYGGCDAKYTYPVFMKQRRKLKEEGLQEPYADQMAKVPTVVLAQAAGFPIDQEKVKELQQFYDKRIFRLLRKISEAKEIEMYRKRFGDFNPHSPDNVAALFRDVLKRKEGRRGKKYSVDEEVLTKIGTKLAKRILRLRQMFKSKGTFIDPLDKEFPTTVIYPDGCVHTQYNTAKVATTRLSSEDPNLQNYPKRNPETKKIRQCFKPWSRKVKEVIIAADYGALEFRSIGMASMDKNLIKACWDDYDVHAFWATRIKEAYPNTYKNRATESSKYDFKAWRNEVKNQFVFPCFYGAGIPSMAVSLEMPEKLLWPIYEDLWREFPDVRRWQKRILRFYGSNGYTQLLNGYRRHGPLTPTQVINTVPQGSGALIVMDAMNRLSERSIKEDREYLHPRLNVHDDLSFIVPECKVENAMEVIIKDMCTTRYSWAKVVPILIEVSVGDDWYTMEDVGKFRSDQIGLN